MSMRSPSENFIKFLVSKKEYHANQIVALLEDYSLSHNVTTDYVRDLDRSLADKPDPKDLAGSLEDRHAAREWYKKHGILDLFLPTADVAAAYGILTHYDLRKNLEPLLLSPLRIEEVAKRINKHHKTDYSTSALETYAHYFWNKQKLNPKEWMLFLDSRGEFWSSATAMNVSPDVAHMVVPWVTGMEGPPPNLNTGIVSRRMRDVAFMKVLETERHPACMDHSKMMKNYMDVIKAAESEMRQSDVALKDVLKAFEKFRMKRVESAVPSIAAVAGDNYSQSGGGTDGMAEDEVLLEELEE